MGNDKPINISSRPPPLSQSSDAKDPWFILKVSGWVALVFIAVLIVLAGPLKNYQPVSDFTFNPLFLISALNTFFIFIIVFIVSLCTIYIFLKIAFQAALWLGAGAFVISISAFISSWFNGASGYNFSVTVFCTGVLLGAIFNLVGTAMIFWTDVAFSTRKRVLLITALYSFSFIWVLLISIGEEYNVLPALYIPGAGITTLGNTLLSIELSLKVLAGILLLRAFARSKQPFLSWYVSGLFYFAMGLLIINFISWEGDLINWLGRLSQYAGCVMWLMAVISVIRESRFKNLPVDHVIADFSNQSKVNYKNLVKAAADAIIAIDGLGRIIMWNPAAELMFGYRQSEAIGMQFFNVIITPEQMENYQAAVDSTTPRLHKPGQSPVMELAAVRKNREKFPIEITLVSGILAKGKLPVSSTSTLIIRDITEHKKTDQMKDDFIGMVSHELRTPLTVIIGALRTLELPDLSGDDIRILLQESISSANTMAGIIENLLELRLVQIVCS